MKIQVKFNLLPADYKAPVGSDIFMKMAKAGSPIKFIIVGPAITGYSYWTNDKQCIRSREKPTETPNIKVEDGKTDRVSHFWMLPVFDCATETVKVLDITQRGIQTELQEIYDSGDYNLGDLSEPTAIKISATGENLRTKYSIRPIPTNIENFIEKLEASELGTLNMDEIAFTPASTPISTPSPKVETPEPSMTAAQAQDMM